MLLLIPAYNPDARLLSLVVSLSGSGAFERIIVVDDGSRRECDAVFEPLRGLPGVDVLKHAVNQGKGAALKTGLNHAMCRCERALGIVTADADGQHQPHDVLAVAEQLRAHPDELTLGVRSFRGPVPVRSRIGNALTRCVFRLLVGVSLRDTQSGLRGIPREFASQLMHIKAVGYEFELDMLIQSRASGLSINPVPVATVYEDGNPSSHFDPLWDSLRIYFVFLRFMMASLITTAVSLVAFHLTYVESGSLLVSEVVLRLTGILINFHMCRGMVFHARGAVARRFLWFVLLVLGMGVMSYFLTWHITTWYRIDVLPARITTALILYLANFSIQRTLIFGAQEDLLAASRNGLPPIDIGSRGATTGPGSHGA